MSRWLTLLDRLWTQTGTWLPSGRGQTVLVLVLLTTHAGLLAYSATRHSPTHLEPAFLAAGISHWQYGRFELYRVNPPLPRMIAALPVLAAGCKTDWSSYHDHLGSRAEFAVGEDFIKANGTRSIPLFFYARWACIPFSLIGTYFAYRWAKELYGNGPGLATLVLWAFEPNLLAHAELVTPDAACCSFGVLAGYTFWRWLKLPTWPRAGLAGAALGLAQLSKITWIILFGLWPLLWLAWCHLNPKPICGRPPERPSPVECPQHYHLTLRSQLHQFASILGIAIYLINVGYGFDGTFSRLKDFQFVSLALAGPQCPGNRFHDSWANSLPVPFPKQYVLGFDMQQKDLEKFSERSYLRGEWQDGGWWYYYLYGLLVKTPCGTLGLFALVVVNRLLSSSRPVSLRDELVLLVPPITLLAIVSSHLEFNIHLRYVFPSLGLGLIWISQGMNLPNFSPSVPLTISPSMHTRRRRMLPLLLLVYTVVSCMLVYPHHLSYFNDFAGGPKSGYRHILGSSFDWGQDLLFVKEWESRAERPITLYVPAGRVSAVQEILGLHPATGPRHPDNRLVVVSLASPIVAQQLAVLQCERIGTLHVRWPWLDDPELPE